MTSTGVAVASNRRAWYRGIEVRFINGQLEFLTRDNTTTIGKVGRVKIFDRPNHAAGEPLPTARKRHMVAPGNPGDFAEHVRVRVNAFWFDFQSKHWKGVSMDGIPWEIHQLHHKDARAGATEAYIREYEVIAPVIVADSHLVIDWIPWNIRATQPSHTYKLNFPDGDITMPSYVRLG